MRAFFIIFSVIACIYSQTRGKPLHALASQNRDTGEMEYDNCDEREADDYSPDEQESLMDGQRERFNDQRDSSKSNQAVEMNSFKHRNSNSEPDGLTPLDNFSDLSSSNGMAHNDKTLIRNVDSMGPVSRYIQTDGFAETEQEAPQHLSNNEFKISRDLRPAYETGSKRAIMKSNEEGDLLFEHQKDQDNNLDKSEYVGTRENIVDNTQSRFPKQIFNDPLETTDFPDYTLEKGYRKLPKNINRDRRQVQNEVSKEANEPTLSPEENENDELAIKRHIKRLSEQEREELFNTLSEDKRNLLKKILENDIDLDSEGKNKREITKKAGAVEENNYMDSNQLDSSKNQGVSSNVDDVNTESSMNHETTENNKRTLSASEIGDVASPKNTGSCEKTDNKAELNNQNGVKETKPESNLESDTKKSDTEVDLTSNSQTVVKSEIKRSTNISEMADILKTDETQVPDGDMNSKEYKEPKSIQHFFSNDEALKTTDEEIEQDDSYKNNLKREAYLEPNFSDSLKSLEESFPNANAYDETNSFLGSDMAPLVRVKRRNAESAMVKRAANVFADSNVPYFPNKGENDDEDNEEGSEFDEDGFYDRTSNFARNNVNKPFDINGPKDSNKDLKQKSGQYNGYNHFDSDTMSLGSDTDNVMTGVEGVNDNIMFSGSRNRRTLKELEDVKDSTEYTANDFDAHRMQSTPLHDGKGRAVSEMYINVPSYQEIDAFGPLPRNYEGDLGRYKRIRRVKQSPDFQDSAP